MCREETAEALQSLGYVIFRNELEDGDFEVVCETPCGDIVDYFRKNDMGMGGEPISVYWILDNGIQAPRTHTEYLKLRDEFEDGYPDW